MTHANPKASALMTFATLPQRERALRPTLILNPPLLIEWMTFMAALPGSCCRALPCTCSLDRCKFSPVCLSRTSSSHPKTPTYLNHTCRGDANIHNSHSSPSPSLQRTPNEE